MLEGPGYLSSLKQPDSIPKAQNVKWNLSPEHLRSVADHDQLSSFQKWYDRKIKPRKPGRGQKPRDKDYVIKAHEQQARQAAKDLARDVRKFRKLDKGVDGQALPGSFSGRNFIVDSGASFNLVGYSSLSKAERKRVRKAAPVALNIANGIVQADEVLDIYVHDLGITIEFYLLPDVPPVISMGFLTK